MKQHSFREKQNNLGMGYYDCIVPVVIIKNMLQNAGIIASGFNCYISIKWKPGWTSPYTPYQAEIAQGRSKCYLIDDFKQKFLTD